MCDILPVGKRKNRGRIKDTRVFNVLRVVQDDEVCQSAQRPSPQLGGRRLSCGTSQHTKWCRGQVLLRIPTTTKPKDFLDLYFDDAIWNLVVDITNPNVAAKRRECRNKGGVASCREKQANIGVIICRNCFQCNNNNKNLIRFRHPRDLRE